jgi:serine/threonine-protein kinase
MFCAVSDVITRLNAALSGRYAVERELGEGGMATVYLANDVRHDRKVALKVLKPELAAVVGAERFLAEIKTTANLQHPNILPLFDSGTADSFLFYVMPYVEGESLGDRLDREHQLPVDDAIQIAKNLAEALDYAHRRGVIHRDIKPANVLLLDGKPVISDFGIALAVGVAGGGRLTETGLSLGTPHYMSPEQATGDAHVGPATDIYALGCVLYEMLVGEPPYTGSTPQAVLGKIITEPPPLATKHRKSVPANVEATVNRALEKMPADRFRSAGEFAKALGDAGFRHGEVAAAGGAATQGPWKRLAIAGWSVAALVTLALGWAVSKPATAPVVTRLDIVTPPTADPYSFALSPDARQIVFVADAEGVSQLWLRPLDQTDARPLPGTERASQPFWVPDGRALGFFADGKLKRIDLTGGAPQILADAGSQRGGTWNGEGVIVFAPSGASGLAQVPATGGPATALTPLAPGQTSHRWPQFLPDGRRFLFFAQGRPDTQGVYLGSLDGGEPTRLLAVESVAAYAPPGYLLNVSQGVLFARPFDAARGVVSGDPLPVAAGVGADLFDRSPFAVSAAGVLAYRGGGSALQQLVWVDRAGQPRGVVPPEEARLGPPELAPDGRQVAVERYVQGNLDVWLIEVARGLASRFTLDPAIDGVPLWSPDGSRLVFRSTRNGPYDLFEKRVNGTEDEEPLLVTPQNKTPQAWSSDGRFLLYTASQDANALSADLWALPLVGERTPFPVVQTSFDEGQGQFSPDGRWIAYASNETGRYEVYVRPFPDPGGRWQVSTGGGIWPRWRRDGMELFYVAPDNQMMAAPIQVAADGRALSPGAPVALFPTRLTAGNGIGGGAKAQFAVAPDGRFLLNVAVDDAAAAPITLVLNWTAALGN